MQLVCENLVVACVANNAAASARRSQSSNAASACPTNGTRASGSASSANPAPFAADTPSPTIILQEINLAISPGEVVGLAGASGSGKSTLISALMGSLPQAAGQHLGPNVPQITGQTGEGRVLSLAVETCPQAAGQQATSPLSSAACPPPRTAPAAPRGLHIASGRVLAGGRVARVMQRPERQLFAETAFDDAAFAPRNLGATPAQAEAQATRALEAVGLDAAEARRKSPFAYSGGQRRRLAIACALAANPDFLLLDEPTAGLDSAQISQLSALIAALADGSALGKPVGVLASSHNADFLWRTTQRIYALAPAPVTGAAHRPNLGSEGAAPNQQPAVPAGTCVRLQAEATGQHLAPAVPRFAQGQPDQAAVPAGTCAQPGRPEAKPRDTRCEDVSREVETQLSVSHEWDPQQESPLIRRSRDLRDGLAGTSCPQPQPQPTSAPASHVAFAGPTAAFMANPQLTCVIGLAPHTFAKTLGRLERMGAYVPESAWASPDAALSWISQLLAENPRPEEGEQRMGS